MSPLPVPPATTEALLVRARGIAGRTLAELAARLGQPVPADLRRHKGWVGQLVETTLGATAGSRAQPDFPKLGVELKTLPVTTDGRPRESTYVCTAPLDGTLEATWAESWVRKKLARVLWVPILGDGATPPAARRVGTPWLWTPTAEDDALLSADWQELARIIRLGELWDLDARHGKALQVRPKAAHGREHTWVLDDEGAWARDTPRGFYLRPSFTHGLLTRALRLPGAAGHP